MFENFRLTYLAVIPVLGLLIFVHELGHFLAARWMKVRVLEFGFGYPPRMLKLFERNGVEYTLNWLPFGGFVRMAGEDGNYEIEGSLALAAPWRRIIVLAAGPFLNFVTAVLLYAALLMIGTPVFKGDANLLPVAIVSVAENSPAALANVRPGDVILQINGNDIRGMDAVRSAIQSSAGQELAMTMLRGDENISLKFTPRLPEDIPPGEGSAGIQIGPSDRFLTPADFETERTGPVQALAAGVSRTVDLTVGMITGLADLLRRLVLPAEPMPAGGVGGLVAIGRIAAQVAEQGWRDLLTLTVFLSINLGVINLLPIPALDGGRILFALVEMVRRKRIPPEKEALVHFAGFALLIALMVFITFVDVSNWIAGKPPVPGG